MLILNQITINVYVMSNVKNKVNAQDIVRKIRGLRSILMIHFIVNTWRKLDCAVLTLKLTNKNCFYLLKLDKYVFLNYKQTGDNLKKKIHFSQEFC